MPTLTASQQLEALRLKQAWGSDDEYGIALCLEVLAWITARQGRHRRAATLLGAAETLWTRVGIPISTFGHFVGYHATCERHVRDALGDAAFTDGVAHGRNLTLENVLAYALGEPRQPVPAPREDSSISLTRREREVADLVAHGLSNRDIAARLVISQRTAESHVENILTKLGFTSRAQIAAWVAAHRTGSPG